MSRKSTAKSLPKPPIKGRYFSLLLGPFEQDLTRVESGGIEEFPAGAEASRENSNCHTIVYIQSGRGSLITNGENLELKAGLVFYSCPKSTYRITASKEGPLIKHFVNFSGRGAAALIDKSPFEKSSPVYVSRTEAIQKAFYNFHQLPGTRMHVRRLSELFLETLLLQVSALASRKRSTEDPSFDTYQRCRHYIVTNYAYMNSLAEVADACSIDSTHLCRLFKKYDKTSPYKLLIGQKMQKAAELLTHSNKLVKQVGMELGYVNQYHFSRIFKSHFGISPTEFAGKRRR